MRPTLPATLALAALTGCTCGAEPPAPARGIANVTGGESRPAIAYPIETAASLPEAFERITGDAATAALEHATRAGSWAGTRRGGEERRSAGNFLCRLETLFGPAAIREPGRVAHVLRVRESGLVLTAVADASGPWLGARDDEATPEAQTHAAEAAIDLARLLDATTPEDCVYTLGGVEVGVRAGQWF